MFALETKVAAVIAMSGVNYVFIYYVLTALLSAGPVAQHLKVHSFQTSFLDLAALCTPLLHNHPFPPM